MFTKGKTPDANGLGQQRPAGQMPAAAPSADQTKRPSAANRSAPSLISADVSMKGEITSQGEIQVDGSIEGNIRSTALTIGNTGAVKGEVAADTVVVRGSVTGSIRGKKVQLCTGAKVEGDITHASLSIEPNAIFEGQVRHSQDPLAAAAAPAAVPPKLEG